MFVPIYSKTLINLQQSVHHFAAKLQYKHFYAHTQHNDGLHRFPFVSIIPVSHNSCQPYQYMDLKKKKLT